MWLLLSFSPKFSLPVLHCCSLEETIVNLLPPLRHLLCAADLELSFSDELLVVSTIL